MRLEKIGPVQRVMRPEVEGGELLTLAATSLVASPGRRPSPATTHVDLQLRSLEPALSVGCFTACPSPPLSLERSVCRTTGLVVKRPSPTPTAGGSLRRRWKWWRNWDQGFTPSSCWISIPPVKAYDQRPMTPADAARSMRMMWSKPDEREPRDSEDAEQTSVSAAVEAYLKASVDDVRVVLCSDTPEQRIVTTTVAGLEDESGGRLNPSSSPQARVKLKKALARWTRVPEDVRSA